jgi:hypothetical protein
MQGEPELDALLARPECYWINRDLEQKAQGYAIAHVVPEHLDEVRSRKLSLMLRSARHSDVFFIPPSGLGGTCHADRKDFVDAPVGQCDASRSGGRGCRAPAGRAGEHEGLPSRGGPIRGRL